MPDNLNTTYLGPHPLPVSNSTRLPRDIIFSNLSVAGTSSMKTNKAGSVITYAYTVPAGRTFDLHRVNVVIVDGNADPADFGGISGSLTTGCAIRITDSNNSVLQNFGDIRIKKNADWHPLAGIDMQIVAGTGDEAMSVRWTLASTGAEMRLGAGESFCVTVEDDLSALTEFTTQVQGILNRSD